MGSLPSYMLNYLISPLAREIEVAEFVVRFKSLNKEDQFMRTVAHYDPVFNFIYLPKPDKDIPIPRTILSYVHETVHNDLTAGSIIGYMLDSLAAVFAEIGFVLGWRHVYPGAGALGFFVNGDKVSNEEEYLKFLSAHKEEFTPLLADKHFQKCVHGLRLIEYRKNRILSNWKICQEGLATWFQINYEHIFPNGYLDAIRKFFPNSRQDEQNRMYEMIVAGIKALESAVREEDPAIPKHYVDGFLLFEELQQQLKDYRSTIDMAYIASHIPYFGCDLLDMSDTEFDSWANSTLLNPDLRLRAILNNSDLIRSYLKKESGIEQVLSALLGNRKIKAISEGAELYGEWERSHLLNSKVRLDCLGAEFQRPRGVSASDFDVDMRQMIRHYVDDALVAIDQEGRLSVTTKPEVVYAVAEKCNRYLRAVDTLYFVERLEHAAGLTI